MTSTVIARPDEVADLLVVARRIGREDGERRWALPSDATIQSRVIAGLSLPLRERFWPSAALFRAVEVYTEAFVAANQPCRCWLG